MAETKTSVCPSVRLATEIKYQNDSNEDVEMLVGGAKLTGSLMFLLRG